jgi:uncharacterized protein YegJ (DUF2314 family)
MTKPFQPLIILSVCLSCSNNSSNHLGSDKLGFDSSANIYAVTAEDSSMNSAIAKARKTIDKFDRALKTNNSAYTDFAVKKRYETPDDGGEHMWVIGITIVNGNYKGFVNNDAEKTTEVKYGDTVIVQKDEITDWMYLDKNVLRGGYTIREMRNKLSKDERIKMDKKLGLKIED